MAEVNIKYIQLSQKHLDIVQNILEKYAPKCEIWAYGSRVQGTAHAGSDLDLVIKPSENFDSFYGLREAFQESMLPMLVDIFIWDQLPKEFQKNIEKSYIILQKNKGMATN